MSYNPATTSLVDPIRPAFITAGRVNMVHPVMMLHHRIPWNLLRTTLNNALGVPFTYPPFRHWVHPNNGPLTALQSQTLTVTVTTRAKKLGKS
jgi:hypothetical protein